MAEINLVKDYLGTSTSATYKFKSRTGEWDKLNFPVQSNPILVYVVNGETSWAPLLEHVRGTYFDPSAMRQVGRVDLRSLPRNEEGMVLLAELVERLRIGK